MLRFIIYLSLLIIISIAGTWLFNNDGVLSIEWLGYKLETSVTFASFFTLASVFLTITAVEILLWIKRAPAQIGHEIMLKRRIKGYLSLTEGFAALMEGDLKKAKNLASTSHKLIPEQPYSHLISSEVAKLQGDIEESTRHLAEMLEDKKTEVLALKGLVNNTKTLGRMDMAIDFAKKAYQLKPKSDWTNAALLDLYKKTEKWNDAIEIYEKSFNKGWIPFRNGKTSPKEIQNKQDYAIVLLLQSKKSYYEGNIPESYKLIKKSYSILPDMMPVLTHMANIYIAMKKPRSAIRIVEKAWKVEPCGELADIYVLLMDNLSLDKKIKKFVKLHETNPNHPESIKAIAIFAMEQNLHDIARKYLEQILEKRESTDLLKLMAKLEEETGGSRDRINQLLKKAELSSPGYRWVCNECNHSTNKWEGICLNCKSFNSYSWSNSASAKLKAYSAEKIGREEKKLAVG